MEERRKQIVNLVNQEGMISFAQLKRHFPQVSDMTLRTDLKQLDSSRQLVRVHGGAKSVTYVVGTDDLISRRKLRCPEEKTCIAQKAVSLLRPNDTIFLDSGTTATEFARHIPDEEFIIFTTSIDCVYELAKLTRPKVYVLGGHLKPASMCVSGARTILEMDQLTFNVAFLGATSYNEHVGFGCGGDDDSTMKRVAIEHAEKAVVLMDRSKVGLASTFSFAKLRDIHTVITDDGIDKGFVELCRLSGVEVL